MESLGIPGSIDLTENNDFRCGVKKTLHDRRFTPNVTPWNHDGSINHNFPNSPRGMINVSSTNGWATNIFTQTIDLSEVEFQEISSDDDLIYSPSRFKDWIDPDKDAAVQLKAVSPTYPALTEDPESIRQYLPECEFVVKRNGIFFKKDADGNYARGYKQWLCDEYDTFDYRWSSTSSSDWSISVNNSTSYTVKITQNARLLKNMNLLPKSLQNIDLTDAEFTGEKLITGNGYFLKDKYRLYKYLKEVQDIISEYTPRYKNDVKLCYECNTHYVALHHDRCPVCSLKRYLSQQKPSFTPKTTLDAHNQKMRGKAHRGFAAIDGQSDPKSGILDFFRQPYYTDHGAFLMSRDRFESNQRANRFWRMNRQPDLRFGYETMSDPVETLVDIMESLIDTR